jgi:hypothetical protein
MPRQGLACLFVNEWHLIISGSASPAGLPYEGMAPSGPLYFPHKATPPTMPPILGGVTTAPRP